MLTWSDSEEPTAAAGPTEVTEVEKKKRLRERRARKKMRRAQGIAIKHVKDKPAIEGGSARGGRRGGRGRGRGRGGRAAAGGRGAGSRPRFRGGKRLKKGKKAATIATDATTTDGSSAVPTEPRFAALRSSDESFSAVETQLEELTAKRKERCHSKAEQMQDLLTTDAKVFEHLRALETDKKRYLRTLNAIVNFKIITTVSTASKAKILAALLIKGERETAEWLLSLDNDYSVGEVAKCLTVLDAPRKARQLRRKYEALLKQELKMPGCVKLTKVSELKKEINNLETELHMGSLSGAKIRLFRRWLRAKDSNTLSFWLLSFPPDNWRTICDLLHTSPTGDFKLDFFQHAMFEGVEAYTLKKKKTKKDAAAVDTDTGKGTAAMPGTSAATDDPILDAIDVVEDIKEEAASGKLKKKKKTKKKVPPQSPVIPVDSLVSQAKTLRQDNVVELCRRFPYLLLCFSYVRKKVPSLSAAAKLMFACEMPLQDVLWWYHELHCPKVEATVLEKLQSANEQRTAVFDSKSARSNYGKLMERLLDFIDKKYSFVDALKPQIQRSLSQLRVPGSEKLTCGVFGDKSGSMSVAVKSATIIASLMSVALNADLTFFDTHERRPPCVPRSVDETIAVVRATHARGGTSMAAALWPYMEKRTKLDLIVLVSDEGENGRTEGMYFDEMFEKYREQVHAASRVFLVSFIGASEKGAIQRRMDARGLEYKLFRLAQQRPDTSKFESLLGLVSLLVDNINEPKRELTQFFVSHLGLNNEVSTSLAAIIAQYAY